MGEFFDAIQMTETGGWLIATATLAAMACSTLGVFLLLRRLSLVGDALSHSVLPGFAIAALISGGLDPFVMLIGAMIAGVLTTWVTHLIRTYAMVPEDAALGVTFTAFFALGMAIIGMAQQGLAIDPHIVLYGDLSTALIKRVDLLGMRVPEITLQMIGLLIVNVGAVALMWRPLKAVTFDEAYAKAIGLRAGLTHFVLMTLTAATIVICFRAVGAILVVALIVIPAAGAYLLSDRLWRLILISWALGFGASVAGRYAALWADTSVAGSIGAAHGAVVLLVFFLAPKYGLLARFIRHTRLALRMIQEDILALLWRVHAEQPERDHLPTGEIAEALGGGLDVRLSLLLLHITGRVHRERGGLRLAESAYDEARHLVRRHRVWESWLHKRFGDSPDTVHPSADRMMHVLPNELAEELRDDLDREARRDGAEEDSATLDPHGRPIP